jgi:hypothetical protein
MQPQYQRGSGNGGSGGGRSSHSNNSRNQARSGNGRGHGNRQGNNQSRAKPKETSYMFTTHTHGAVQTATYQSIKEHIANKIQKTLLHGHDVAQSIRDGVLVDLEAVAPRHEIAVDTHAATRAAKQREEDIKCQALMTAHATRTLTFQSNLQKAYAMIMDDYVSPSLRHRIRERPDYHTMIEDNPLVLLTTILTCLHEPTRQQHPLIMPLQHAKAYLQFRMIPDETLTDYTKRFKQAKDMTKDILGTRMLDHYVEQQDDYIAAAYVPDPTDLNDFLGPNQQWKETLAQKDIKLKFHKKMEAMLFLQGADPTKYGSLTKGLQQQHSLDNNQYPVTVEGVVNTLNQHPYDQQYYDIKKKDRDNRKKNNSIKEDTLPAQQSSFAQKKTPNPPPSTHSKLQCHCCGKFGHHCKFCPDVNKIAKNDWFVNRAMSAMQSSTTTAASDDDSSITSAPPPPQPSSRSVGSHTRDTQRAGNWQGLQFLHLPVPIEEPLNYEPQYDSDGSLIPDLTGRTNRFAADSSDDESEDEPDIPELDEHSSDEESDDETPGPVRIPWQDTYPSDTDSDEDSGCDSDEESVTKQTSLQHFNMKTAPP